MRKLYLVVAILLLSATAALAAPYRWPALEQQLKKDRVVPNSRLEKLIRENQEFGMLRKEEARDDLDIPLWLRVLWRKAHPEIEYTAEDPTGGYPHVLREVHEWLVTHQDLLPGPRELDVPPAQNRTVFGANLRISGLQTAPRSESDIRVDYWNPNRIISGSNNIVASGHQAQYWSNNSGATWGQTTLSLAAGDAFHSDPTVDWTSNGDAWATTLASIPPRRSCVCAPTSRRTAARPGPTTASPPAPRPASTSRWCGWTTAPARRTPTRSTRSGTTACRRS